MVMRLSVRVCCSSWQVCIGRLSTSSGSGLSGSLYFQGGGHALHARLVSTKQALSLEPPTSHDARARHPRVSQAAVTSDARPAVGAQCAPHLQRLGAAVRRHAAPREAAERRRDVA